MYYCLDTFQTVFSCHVYKSKGLLLALTNSLDRGCNIMEFESMDDLEKHFLDNPRFKVNRSYIYHQLIEQKKYWTDKRVIGILTNKSMHERLEIIRELNE